MPRPAGPGGWDWGPYSTTYQREDHTFSFGIWKNVYLLPVRSALRILNATQRTL